MREYKTPLGVRSDSLYCPLCFALDTYWNCVYNCRHCFLRNFNEVWGKEQRVTDPVKLRRKMENGMKNKNPKSPLAHCLALKKTIRWGNKSDPFQPVPGQKAVSEAIFDVLYDLQWSYIIQTMNTKIMMDYEDRIVKASRRKFISGPQVTIMPVISPGLESDWELFERGRTNSPIERLEHLQVLRRQGVAVGVNGEPFIPGYHTVKDFEECLKVMKSFGIRRYNTYNLHFTPLVAKRLHSIGVDIEKVFKYNTDEYWKPILAQLLELSKKYGIMLGCPDWVNTGTGWKERANTCCGVHAVNPSRYNAHEFKRRLQQGEDPEAILEDTWEGIGDREEGRQMMYGETEKMYTLVDAGFNLSSPKK